MAGHKGTNKLASTGPQVTRPKKNKSPWKPKPPSKQIDSTKEWKAVVIEALKVSPKLSVAALVAGVHRKTIQEARANDEEFNQACFDSVEFFRAKTLVEVQNKAIQLAKEGNEKMIEFVLKRFDPRYERSKSSFKFASGGEDGEVTQVETETDRTINIIRITTVKDRAEVDELRRQQKIANQAKATIDEPTNGNGHAGGNGKHNGNGNGKK